MSGENAYADGMAPDWLINATTMLSADPVIGDSAIDPLATVGPSIDPTIDPPIDLPIDPAVDPAIDRSLTEHVSLSHFDCSMLVVSARLAEIERLLVVHHMNSVSFPDDPLVSRDGDNKGYRTRVFNAPPRSRSALSRRYRTL